MNLANRCQPTGVERFFEENEVIVSKTDPKGRITYANQVFLRVAGYSERELIGAPHNIIRHPMMPRCVFKFMWDVIPTGKEIFAYVINLCKGGDHYWVLAHVTATYDSQGLLIGYHSTRRRPKRDTIATVTGLYRKILEVEAAESNPKRQCKAGLEALTQKLSSLGVSYDEFIMNLATV